MDGTKSLGCRLGFVGDGVVRREVEVHERREILEQPSLVAGGFKGGGHVGRREGGGVDAGLGEMFHPESDEGVGSHASGVFEMQGLELLVVEAGGTAVHAVQIETLDEIGNGEEFLAVAGRPSEEGQVVDDGIGVESVVDVIGDDGALVALAHLGAIRIQDQGHVGVAWCGNAEGIEQGDVLGGVRQVVLAADDMRDAHLQVVDDVDEVEHGLAIAADDDPVRILLLAVG